MDYGSFLKLSRVYFLSVKNKPGGSKWIFQPPGLFHPLVPHIAQEPAPQIRLFIQTPSRYWQEPGARRYRQSKQECRF